MPESHTTPAQPVGDRNQAFPAIQRQQRSGALRHTLHYLAIREDRLHISPISLAESIRERFAASHPTPSFPRVGSVSRRGARCQFVTKFVNVHVVIGKT